jgi:hypothetical protein
MTKKLSQTNLAIAVLTALTIIAAGYLIFSSRAATVKSGDLNNDSTVNIFDLSILLSKWNQSGSQAADLNSDNTVSIFDLSILLSQWGTNPSITTGIVIWQDKFDTAVTGQLTQATGDPLFAPTVAPTEDTDFINVSIIGEGPGGSGKALRHKIPANELGAFIQSPRLPQPTDHATIEYDVRFDSNFDWRWGGKVGAGFVGVTPGTGIYKPTSGNTDRDIGFSARLMWHGRGDDGTRPFQSKLGPIPAELDNDVVTYIYARYPADGFNGFGWHTSLGHFLRGTWHNVKIEVKMNTIGQQDGIFRVWIDGTLRYGATNFDWRSSPDVNIQAILWDIHRGGGLTPVSWISSRDTYIDMANVIVRDLQ